MSKSNKQTITPYTAEDLDALRELSEDEDMMGLGARRLLATTDAILAERDAIREAVRVLETMKLCQVERCEECGAMAACLVTTEEDCFYLCLRHTEERRADKNLPPALEVEDEPVAAPLRALRALLDGK